MFKTLFVGLPGFEPGQTGPESVVLPLYYSPMSITKSKGKTTAEGGWATRIRTRTNRTRICCTTLIL